MSLFSIDEFVAKVSEKGLHDPTKYIVSINSPVGPLTQDGSSYCCAAEIPSIGFDTTQHFIHGPIRQVAHLENYSDQLSLTFYNDYDYTEYNYFYKWMTKEMGGDEFFIKYYDEYKGDLVLVSYDREEKQRFQVNCAEAYPLSLSAFRFGYSRKDLPTFTVTFAVHHVEISK